MSLSHAAISEDSERSRSEEDFAVRNVLVMLGTPIDAITMEGALNRIDDLIAIGRATGKSHQIATVNADFVVKSLSDPQLRRILQEADMATADGMPLVWGARLLGMPIRGRVTGVDMVNQMARRAAQRGHSIYFLGAAPGVAQRAADILCGRYPGLLVAGVASPAREAVQADDPVIVASIRTADPDILLVAFGNPKQEKWIHAHAERLDAPVMMGVGGAFDFIAEVTKRAPDWMQNAGLEWLHRLVHEPRRLWRRYAVDLVGFGAFFLLQWWLMRPQGRTSDLASPPMTQIIDETIVLRVTGSLTAGNCRQFAEMAHAALAKRPFLIINLADADFLDSTAIGAIVALTKDARTQGGNVWLATVPPSIARVLALLRLEQFLDICEDEGHALSQRKRYVVELRRHGQ